MNVMVDRVSWKKFARALRLEMSAVFVCSYFFFLVCMGLDFYITAVGSGGDWSMEGNGLARLWWWFAGPYRFLEIPIWAVVAGGMTYLVSRRSLPFGIFWLNVLAFNHLIGFITWLPYGISELLDMVTRWTYDYPIGLISICMSIPLTLLQIYVAKK